MPNKDSYEKDLKEKEKVHKQMREKYGTPKCPSEYIVREGYKKKSGTTVPPTCIKSRTGRPKGASSVRIPVKPHILDKYGYEKVKEKTELQRHRALSRALEEMQPLELYRRLIALSTLNKRQDPDVSEIFRDDANYVKQSKQYQNRQTAGKVKRSSKKSSSKSKKSKKPKKITKK